MDGVSIYGQLRSWQQLVGYVPQIIHLTEDTLMRNIAFGVADHLINHEQLQRALEAAQLVELAERLPQGINTMVGERGMRLSGGQRQRIGIARASITIGRFWSWTRRQRPLTTRSKTW